MSTCCRDVTSELLKCPVISSVKHENACSLHGTNKCTKHTFRTHTHTQSIYEGGNFIFQAQEAHICHQVSHQLLSRRVQAYTVIYAPLLSSKQLQIPHNLHFNSSTKRKNNSGSLHQIFVGARCLLVSALSRIRNHFSDKTSGVLKCAVCTHVCGSGIQRSPHCGKRSLHFH